MVGVRTTVVVAAIVTSALLFAPSALQNHLPGCLYAGGSHLRGASPKPRVGLRIATIPKNLKGTDQPLWVLTVTNRTSRPRSLGFADSAYAEIQLWRNGRRAYSWYRTNIHQQAFWGRVVRPRSSWSCVQRAADPLDLRPGPYTLVAWLRTTSGPRARVRRAIMLG
jgi:Intracellular proteinase inhibitor